MSGTLTTSYQATSEKLPLLGEEAILETLYEVGLPEELYIVLGGANMVLRGIKPTTQDVDLLVSEEGFALLRERPASTLKRPPARAVALGAANPTVWVHDNETPMPISATESLGDGFYPMTFWEFKGQSEAVRGIPCLNLDNVIESKKALQRPKDKEDLMRIGTFLGVEIQLPIPTVALPHIESTF